jgi:hypothetical protein
LTKKTSIKGVRFVHHRRLPGELGIAASADFRRRHWKQKAPSQLNDTKVKKANVPQKIITDSLLEKQHSEESRSSGGLPGQDHCRVKANLMSVEKSSSILPGFRGIREFKIRAPQEPPTAFTTTVKSTGPTGLNLQINRSRSSDPHRPDQKKILRPQN